MSHAKKLSKVQKQNIKYLEKKNYDLKKELEIVKENTLEFRRIKEKILDGILVKKNITSQART